MHSAIPTIIFLLIALALFIYIALSSIEYGMAFFQMFPKIRNSPSDDSLYVKPVWETTTVFLVFAIIGIMTFFPAAFAAFGRSLLPLLFITVLLMAVRGALMLILHYAQSRSRAADLLFLLFSLAIPVSLSVVFSYAMTGSLRIAALSPLALSMALLVISGVLLISGTFWRMYDQRFAKVLIKKITPLDRFIKIIFGIFIATSIFFAENIFAFVPHMNNSSDKLLGGIAILLFIIVSLFFLRGEWRNNPHEEPTKSFATAVVLLAIVFGCAIILQLPYIIFPNITIANAITDNASLHALLITTVIGGVVTLPCLGFLYYLFFFAEKNSRQKNPDENRNHDEY
jgi:cytochrome d ubiquinol oxidase subunit II